MGQDDNVGTDYFRQISSSFYGRAETFDWTSLTDIERLPLSDSFARINQLDCIDVVAPCKRES
jgi:hypothetical protein